MPELIFMFPIIIVGISAHAEWGGTLFNGFQRSGYYMALNGGSVSYATSPTTELQALAVINHLSLKNTKVRSRLYVADDGRQMIKNRIGYKNIGSG